MPASKQTTSQFKTLVAALTFQPAHLHVAPNVRDANANVIVGAPVGKLPVVTHLVFARISHTLLAGALPAILVLRKAVVNEVVVRWVGVHERNVENSFVRTTEKFSSSHR